MHGIINKCIQLDDKYNYAQNKKGNVLDSLEKYQKALEW